jgi:hypothetical protein
VLVIRSIRPLVPLAVAASLLVAAVPALAKGGNSNRVTRSGDCSGSANWKLKAKPDNGKLEVEFEVDQNRNGVKWNVVIKRNGNTAVSTTARTKAPSGSFSVNRLISGTTGKITATATRSGESCKGSVTV